MKENMRKKEIYTDGELTIEELLDEKPDDKDSHENNPEKLKRQPRLDDTILQALNNPNSPINTDLVKAEIAKYHSIQNDLKTARKNYRFEKLAIDTFYYVPSIIHLCNRLINESVTKHTIPEGATLFIIMWLIVLAMNIISHPDPNDKKKVEKWKSSYKSYEEKLETLRTKKKEIRKQTKKIRLIVEELGLDQSTLEFAGRYSIPEAIERIENALERDGIRRSLWNQ